MRRAFLHVGLCMVVFACGCQSTYYKTMEVFGQHKRDILVDRVSDTQQSQEEAKEQFASALDEFSALINFQGGELKEKYDKLKAELEMSEDRAAEVRGNINKVESVAKALFKEWEAELADYSSDKLKRSSERKLVETRLSYEQLITVMKQAESKMEPVLIAFRDQVLFLKHNLNAQAVASLREEFATMENDIAELIREMEASIAEADEFIKSMGLQ